MNSEDALIPIVSPNKRESKPQHAKYISLMLTMILVACMSEIEKEKEKNEPIQPIQYLPQILYVVAFLISCFSQYLGHRKLYLISYLSQITFLLVVYLYEMFKEYQFLQALTLFRYILFIQVKIQTYGSWPKQFARKFVEFYLFSLFISKLLYYIPYKHKEIFIYVIYLVNLVLIFLKINNFKSPETDGVCLDFSRLLFNLKPLIFTIILGFSDLLRVFLKKQILTQVELEMDNVDTITLIELSLTAVIIVSFIILEVKLIQVYTLQPTLIILISLAILLFVSIRVEILILLDFTSVIIYLSLYLILIIFFVAQIMYSIPQYQIILQNMGIRNLDFASSYQSLAFGVIYLSNNQIAQNNWILENLHIMIPSLFGIISLFSFIFYQLLGFRNYLLRSRRAYVEEIAFSIEII